MTTNEVDNIVSGVLVIDKPIGLTSHDIVKEVRNGTGIRRVGHTGTLDPRASGVLVVLLGPAVRLSEYVSASDKRYHATIRLGSSTDTYDSEGTPSEEMPLNVDELEFNDLLKTYEGEQEQVPPPYSAVKVSGKKAYELARKGENVELEPRMIQVYSLDMLEWAPPDVVIDMHCSSGTYVRSLAHDIGQNLGIGAHLVGLRRTRNGQFTLRDAISLRTLKEEFNNNTWARHLIPAGEALGDWQTVVLDAETLDKVVHGHRFPNETDMTGWARAISDMGDLVALIESDPENNEWQPRKVFYSG